MTRENVTYKRSNKYRGIVNATFKMLPVSFCGKTHWSEKKIATMDNSTNSIQFANLIASRSTPKPDNIFRSKLISFFYFPSRFILLQPLSHVPPITSSSYFVFRFRALPFLYATLFHLLFHVFLFSLHTTAPPPLFSSHNASFTSFFTLYIFQASIFLKSRFATFPHFSSKHPPSFFFTRPITQLLAVAFQLIPRIIHSSTPRSRAEFSTATSRRLDTRPQSKWNVCLETAHLLPLTGAENFAVPPVIVLTANANWIEKRNG